MAEAKAKFDALDAATGGAATAALGGLTPATDKIPYFTSSSAAALATLTAFARTLIANTDAASVRSLLGVSPATDFSSGSTANGYWRRAPDGVGGYIIEQWGTQNSGVNGWSSTYTFPIAFPTTVECIIVSPNQIHPGAADGNAISVQYTSLSSFQIGSDDQVSSCYWKAIGR